MERTIWTENKYHNKKTEVDGNTFDSKREAQRWLELRLLERAGEIKGLQRQVKFELIPPQRDKKTGKLLERSVSYRADFVYKKNGNLVVEDAKGAKTEVYKIKKKLMLYKYDILIQEV